MAGPLSPLEKTKLAFSPYELRSRGAIGKSAGTTRVGVLLRVEHADCGPGYADCHPWPELGDEPMEQQLRLLEQGKPTPLGRRSLALAREDAEHRARGRSAFSEPVPPSHVLSGNALDLTEDELERWAREGFRLVKTKAGKCPDKEARHLQRLSHAVTEQGIKLRIDFNDSLSLDEALAFFDVLCVGDGAKGVDFIEDPVSFRVEDWRFLKKRFPLRLALDRGASCLWQTASRAFDGDAPADLIVLKPAIEEPAPFIDWLKTTPLRLVITSYLDHPLGTAGAAWHATRAREVLGERLETCGLMTHLNYEETAFSRLIGREGARWLPPGGIGFGFDEELSRLDWRSLP